MKSLFEQLSGTYSTQNDYLIPNLTLPKNEKNDISIYGQQHLRYLKEYRKLIYINLLTSGKLDEYLYEIDKQVRERFELLVTQMKDTQGITEQLKSENPIKWVGIMNYIRQRTEEIVITELLIS